MKLTRINTHDITTYPAEIQSLLSDTDLYDSSCSPEAAMTRYFRSKGLAANVLTYLSDEKDWLLTEKIHGDDCTETIACRILFSITGSLVDLLTLTTAVLVIAMLISFGQFGHCFST